MPDNERTCNTCGVTKPLSEFYRRKRGRDGYNGQCKTCVGKTPEQRERDRERTRQWAQENRARHNANTEAYRRRHPERRSARQAVYRAVMSGRLVRQPCEVCGATVTHAHHDDYAKQLEVRWLCPTHHAEADVEHRRAA